MKKRKITAFCAILLCAVLLAVLPLTAFGATQSTVNLRGALNWEDEEDAAGIRPDTVNVLLMNDGETYAETTASAQDGWTFSFDVPAGSASSYTVEAEVPTGYEENAHLDPSVIHTDAYVGEWTKYEPCNELNIPTATLSSSVIAGKMTAHQPAVIWTADKLSSEEQSLVWNALRGRPGVGNPSDIVYISGDGASEFGMTVSVMDGMVYFEKPSNWALIFGAEFTPASDEVQSAAITFSMLPLLDTVPEDEQFDTPEQEPQPEFGTEPEEDIPPESEPEEDIPPVAEPEEDIPPVSDKVPELHENPSSDDTPVFFGSETDDDTPPEREEPDDAPIFFGITDDAETADDTKPMSHNDPALQQPVVDAAAQTAGNPAAFVGTHALDAQPKTGLTPAYYVCGVLFLVSLLGLTVLGATALLKKRSR